jgi:hypothetical protein
MANRLLHLGYADACPAAELLSHRQRLQMTPCKNIWYFPFQKKL